MAKQGSRISDELPDELLGGEDPVVAFRNGDLLTELRKAVAERALDAEMQAHLEDERDAGSGNHRNGHNRKRVLTEGGAMEVAVPRDREGRFEPQLIEKYCRRLPGFDDKVISMYARGVTTREIRSHIEELYGISVSPELFSKVTDAVHDEIRQWQSRPLEETYAIVYFDAIRVKAWSFGTDSRGRSGTQQGGVSGDRVSCAGVKDILGLWIEQTEGAKFWLSVMNELKARGVWRCADRGSGRSAWFSGSDRGRLPRGGRSNLHRSSPAPFAGARLVEGAPGACSSAQTHVPGGDRGRGERRPGRVRGRSVGRQEPGDRAQLACPLGGDHAVSGFLGADPAGDLHDQRDREA